MVITKEQLLRKVEELENAAKKMREPDKTFKLSEIDNLQIEIESMALSEIVSKLQAVSIPKIEEMDQEIAKANNAMETHQNRVQAFNAGVSLIIKILQIAL